MKKIFFSLLVLLSFVISCGKENPIVSGVYEGVGNGRNGEIKVQVHLQDSVITGIDIVETSETEIYAEAVYTDMRYTMITENNINIDVMSGASLSSQGFLEAVEQALTSAGVDLKGKKIQAGEMVLEETEQNYDIVVVGAGGAGFSAAIEAKNNGANVVILEKMSYIGGNTAISGGPFNAPDTWVQQKVGIKDSVDLFYEDTMKGGDYENDPILVKYMAENAKEVGRWLAEYIGVIFYEDKLQHFGGHSVPRGLYPKTHGGSEMIVKQKAKAEELGIQIKTLTSVTDLIVENDRVVGVMATNVQGQTITFNATKGVILATGGFGANIEMRKQYNSAYGEKYLYTGTPGTTGDGITMTKEVEADTTGMKYIQTYPVTNPKTGALSLLGNTRFNGGILINQEGNRFVEELDRRDVVSKAILAQNGEYAYLMWNKVIGDINNVQTAHDREFQTLLEQGLIVKADTIEDAAKFFEIPVNNLLATIDKVNQYAQSGKDLDFNHRGGLVDMAKGPYYIQKAVPSVHHTMGGLKIDKDAHVMDTNGNIIPGLYAAGEVTGGIHGSNRLGGNAITDIVVFGRTAGRNAAKGL